MDPAPTPSPAAGPGAGGATLEALAELVAIVDRLRDPVGGCPWDLAQTHASLIPYALEEAHELADAIRHGDDRHLQEELGDLLLQVLLHARIAGERGAFDLAAVARGIGAKLVRRHPHVFDPEAERHDDPEAVRRSWEAIKATERAEQAAAGALQPGHPQVSPPPAPSATTSARRCAASRPWPGP